MVIECPECQSTMSHSSTGFSCTNCSFSYSRDKYGIVHQKRDTFDYAHTHRSTEQLAEEVKNMGNEFFEFEEIRRLEEKYEEFSHDYCLDIGRFDWLSIGDLDGKVVVDIGCGFGGGSIYAAKQGAKEIYSIDGNLGRLRFLGAWMEKEGIENIHPIHGDATDLNFHEDSVDVCLMVGSLEWVGAVSDTHESPRDAQLELLRQVSQSMTDSGDVYIAIENRFALQHFFGFTSHVVEPPFSTILPRNLADIVSKFTGNGPYDVYTYSYNGYKDLLSEAGFANISFYMPIPTYQHPKAVIEEEQGQITEVISQWDLSFPKSIAKKLLAGLDKVGLGHYFMPAYIIHGKND